MESLEGCFGAVYRTVGRVSSL